MTETEEAVARFYERGTPVILACAILLTAVAGYLAGDLKLDSELKRLLPPSAESVQGLDRLEETYGRQIGRLALVVEGPEAETNEKAVDQLASMLREHKLVREVEAKRPVGFFKERRLLYLDLADAKKAADQITERIDWEKARANPLFADLGSDEPPEVDLSEIEEKYESRLDQQAYLTGEAQTHYVIYVAPTFPNTQFKKTQRLLDEVEAYFQTDIVDADSSGTSPPELTFGGRYVKFFQQQQAITKDLARGTALALVGIILFLILYFRSWLYPLLIAAPLIASTVWSFGWAQLIFGSLNILTGFLGAVLMGLGIDYGIHIVSMFQEARRGHTAKEALIKALEMAGRPSLYAGLTTLIALGSLTYSSFRAFFEFGVLALGGLTLILLSYALVLPVLLLLIADTAIEPDPRMPDEDHHLHVTEHQRTIWRRVATGTLTVLTVLAFIGVPSVAFEFDFRKLMPQNLPAFQVEDKIADIVDMPQPPSVVLVDDQEHARQVSDELRERMKNNPKADIIGEVFTLYDFVPTEQKEKLKLWKEVFDDFQDVPESRREKNERLGDFYTELEKLIDGGTIEPKELPESIRERFRRTDDPTKTVVLIMPSKYVHNANDALKYVEVTNELPGPGGEGVVNPISQEALLADILKHVKSDTVWLILIALIGLLGVAWFAFRDLQQLGFALATVAAGIGIGTGLIGLAGVSFNFMNMVIWPIWLGLGVDAVFHLSNRVEHDPTDWSSFRHTSGAVAAAFFTTMIGFGSLMISRHRGLASLGKVAVIGLGAILLVALALHVFYLKPSQSDGAE